MNLVIQGLSPLSVAHIDTLRQLSATASATKIDASAIQFPDADVAHRDAVAAYCTEHRLDFAYAPERRLADFGLLAMDMDSTLITIECIDEIADYCGLKAQVSAITEAAMRGEITDFNESLRRRVSLLKGLDAAVLEQVYDERVQLSPGAEALIAGVKDAGLATLLVSGGFTYFTERLKRRLGIDEAHANTLEIVNGKLTGRVLGDIVNGDAKARFVLQTCKRLGIDPSQAIALGD